MIHLNVYIYYIMYKDLQNQYKRTLQPPCKCIYIYTHINRDMSSVKHTSLHELNYMKTDFPSPLCKYHYNISVS